MTPETLDPEKNQARILVVEDHQPVRQAILDWLSFNFPQSLFIQAASGEEALRLAGELKPDMVLMDIELPGLNGLEATRQIKKDRPEIMVLILTIHEGALYQKEAARAGANGFLSKKDIYRKMVPLIAAWLYERKETV